MDRFNNILYVFEQSATQESNIARTISLAQNNQARLTFLDVVKDELSGHVMPAGDPVPKDKLAAVVADRRQQLESLLAPYKDELEFNIKIVIGTKFLEVIRSVMRNEYDLVIKPAEDPDWMSRLFGSEDMHLLRKCPCPVWLMKQQEKSNYERIAAAVDFVPGDDDPVEQTLNNQILGLASSIAVSDFAELHIFHAWDAPGAGLLRLWADDPKSAEKNIVEIERKSHTTGMDALMRKLHKQIGNKSYEYLSPRVHLPKGSARKVIPGLVKDLKVDLLVMGTVVRTGIPGFIIGNTAETILDQLQCSVLAVKPPGFISPVELD